MSCSEVYMIFFFFKQKTAYELRISDWSSDVCSSDLKRLQYYRVLVSYMSVVICGGTGYRVARGGKTHQDVVVAWLAMITHPIAEQMRETLEEVQIGRAHV